MLPADVERSSSTLPQRASSGEGVVLGVESVLTLTDTGKGRCVLPRYQLRLLLLCAAQWYGFTAFTMLPPFLMPSVESEWGMSKGMSSLLGTVFFFGQFCGLFVFGVFMDMYGRRRGFVLALVIGSIAGPAEFLTTGPLSLGVVRALAGFAAGGLMSSAIVLTIEFAPPARRATLKALLTTLGWSANLLILISLAFALRDAPWRLMLLCTLPVPALLLLETAGRGVVPESPRYLLGVGDEKGAIEALARVADTNGRQLPRPLRLDGGGVGGGLASGASPAATAPSLSGGDEADGEQGRPPPPSSHSAALRSGAAARCSRCDAVTSQAVRAARTLCELSHPTLRRPAALVGVGFLCTTAGYYAVALASNFGVGLDLYTRQYIGAVVEVPSYLAIPLMADRIGRTRAWGALLGGTAASLLLLAWIEHLGATGGDGGGATGGGGDGGGDSGGGGGGGDSGGGGGGGGSAGVSAGSILLALIARFCIAGASSINYVAAAEQFPTSSRSVGLAFASGCGRLGTFVSPPIAQALSPYAQHLVVGVGTAVGALCVLGLRETLGLPMAERVAGSRSASAPAVMRLPSSSRTAPVRMHD